MLKFENDTFQVGAAEEDKEAYRDTIASIKESGARNWVFAKKPSGDYTRAREIVAFFLLAFFFAGPFIKINGQPLLMLNILERKFIIFGNVFWPSDFHLLAIGGLTLLVTVVIFTAVFGRVWCGWACPQTIFMEMVFRKIEYWIDGDRSKQIRLAKQDWNRDKIFKRVLKHGIYFGISFLIANLFLAYVISYEALWDIITDPPADHLVGLASITLFSIVFYSVFARFREQVCHFACPYGRYQSVMVNEDTISVTYDFVRGENRANQRTRVKAKKAAEAQSKAQANVSSGEVDVLELAQGASVPQQFGDCIDCEECVRVCPMGIDIRNGIQLECVQCTACMDACDNVMEKIGKPKELIKYASYKNVKQGDNTIINTRIKGYIAVLTILMSLFVYLLTTRADIESIITRVPGVLFARVDDTTTSNLFSYKLVNKTFDEKNFSLKLLEPSKAQIRMIGEVPVVEEQGIGEGRFMILLPNSELNEGKATITMGLYVDDELVERIDTRFTGPKN